MEDPLKSLKYFEKSLVSQCRKKLKASTLRDFMIFLSQNNKKMKGDSLVKNKFRKKAPQCRKNWTGGPFGIFYPFYREASKKKDKGPFEEKSFEKKSHNAGKTGMDFILPTMEKFR